MLPDPALRARLAAGDGRAATVVSTDVFYEDADGPRRRWVAAGADAVEMEAAALLGLGDRLGVAVACLLVVSDVFPDGRRRRISDEQLEAAVKPMGEAAAEALRA